jgi:hypothetical protein
MNSPFFKHFSPRVFIQRKYSPVNFIIGIAGITLLSFCLAAPPGVYRWDYKILIDTAGQRVFNMPARRSSVHKLNLVPRPKNSELGNHRAESEKQKVILTAYVVEFGKEADDDFHLVLTNEAGTDSIIAEIPDPSQSKLRGFKWLRKAYTASRDFALQHLNDHPHGISSLPQRVKVKITGVVFFDKRGHGNGHARNGVELHPVLDLVEIP